MLIDSGAEVSVILRVTGMLLGMSRRSGEEVKHIRGAGGGRVPVLYRQVRLTIGDHNVRARVGWIQDGTPLSILGRRDVFRHFSIEFREFDEVTVFRHVSELD